MINDKLITQTDIPTIELIHGEMKNRIYEAQCALEDVSELDKSYYEGLLDAYGFVYSEIDRVMTMRGVW